MKCNIAPLPSLSYSYGWSQSLKLFCWSVYVFIVALPRSQEFKLTPQNRVFPIYCCIPPLTTCPKHKRRCSTTITGISGRKSTQVWLSNSLNPHSVSHRCAGKDVRRLPGQFLSAHTRGPLGSVVCELAETPGLQERGSARAGALPVLPRRCSHCPAPVRLRPLWAAPLHIRIGENWACSGAEGTCPSPGWTCSRKIQRPQEAVIWVRVSGLHL